MRDQRNPGAPPRATSERSSGPAAEDAAILAALDRACRHRPGRAASRWQLLEHLAVGKRTRRAQHVTVRLRELTRGGLLEQRREHNVPVWRLTRDGRRRLRQTAGRVELPESPQHRRWRERHGQAPGELEEGARALRDAIREASALLDQQPPAAGSDAWLLAGIRLDAACRRLACASHCLYEWREPGDARADIDTGTASGVLVASDEEQRTLRARRLGRRTPPAG